MIFNVMIDNANAGLMDGFAEVFTTENEKGEKKNLFVGGSICTDKQKVLDILKKLPDARSGQVVEMNVDKQGDIDIHRIKLNLEKHQNFADFVGDGDIYVATSDKAVWYATGVNGLEEIKRVIELSGKEAPEGAIPGEFASMFMKVGPWLDLRQKRSPDKGDVAHRKMAIEAFANGNDTINLNLRREEKNIKGKMVINQGILAFVGKMIAEFSKETLEE